MPHYYFDLKDGTRLRDNRGLELPTDIAAIEHAKAIAKEAAAENVDGPGRFVSVIHEDGRQVVQVPIATPPDV